MASPKNSPPGEPVTDGADERPRPAPLELRGDAPPAAQDIRDTIIIKDGDAFLLTDLEGNIPLDNPNGLGLYLGDTRMLSTFELSISGLVPTILLSEVRAHFLSSQVLTNPNLTSDDGRLVHEQTIQVRRHRRLQGRSLREALYLQNFNIFPLLLHLSFDIKADFTDIFEVRGLVREGQVGRREPPRWENGALHFDYFGADGDRRSVKVRFDPPPKSRSEDQVHYRLDLAARGSTRIDLTIEIEDTGMPHVPAKGTSSFVRWYRRSTVGDVRIRSSSAVFDAVVHRARADLRMLISGADEPFIAAGTPWFAALFGRDTLIAAMQCLWVAPELAKGALLLLARYQGTKDEPWRDEEPGKILHELRRGELARNGEIPFAPYFGSIDSTPLWVMLLWTYFRTTGDIDLVRTLLPNLEAALNWMERHGDFDGDGFIEYRMRSSSGLVNQGWKDSWDGIVHADGSLAEPPIALIEAQAYAYAARRRASYIYAALGDFDRSAELLTQANRLRERIDEAFWMEDEGTYALALDGNKQQCRVIASNAGHALWCGVPGPERAARVAERLMQEDVFSGWGIRTLSTREVRYNPGGYHVGTVWPHDNALIALGMSRYGLNRHLVELVTAQMDAARGFPDHRMPELFCGYARGAFNIPVRYPVACSPQAWAAGAWPAFMQSMLGLRINARAGELVIKQPILPPWLGWIRVEGIRVGDAEVDLRWERVHDRAAVDVTHMRGDVRVTFLGADTRE